METNLSDHLVVPHVPDILLLRPQDKIKDQGHEKWVTSIKLFLNEARYMLDRCHLSLVGRD